MIEVIATILLIALGIYILIGIVFYFPFIKNGVRKIDEGVKDAPRFMKILIFPGTVALWPILLKKVKKGELS
ncbi:hypothetical protein BFP97_10625 [Roseivirga sp. 4D4]|uniref:hypothetical protein n=1 Tax=Roseivirga sp. 4D4 TaxID=1889784 RepID=UPI000852E55B|nr:hypothetical protein [Roseivirga sp. 4D4]OEK01943.1 hypothetical protein BFP97_10625 [Roseivirga sp. 4D4]